MIRSIAAVLAGYAVSVIAVSAFFALVLAAAFGGLPEDPASFRPPAWLFIVEIATSPVLGAAGGWVCGLVARRRERAHGLALAGLMLLFGVGSAFADSGMKPLWSTAAVVLLGALGAVGGAHLRAMQVRA
jgi:hypothetical protein